MSDKVRAVESRESGDGIPSDQLLFGKWLNRYRCLVPGTRVYQERDARATLRSPVISSPAFPAPFQSEKCLHYVRKAGFYPTHPDSRLVRANLARIQRAGYTQLLYQIGRATRLNSSH